MPDNFFIFPPSVGIGRKLGKQDRSSKANQIKISLPFQRIVLGFADVNPLCSKFNASSKGSTITFPLLPTVYHSWIAKANFCCDFSFARSLRSIFKFVSQSTWVPHHEVLAHDAVGTPALRGTLSSCHTASSGPASRSGEDSVLGHTSSSFPLLQGSS